MAKKLLIARHAETGPQFYGRFIGTTDLPLGPAGPGQAEALARTIAPFSPATVFCSPLRRCRQTAEILHQSGLPAANIDDDLREIDFGRWEGRSFDEIAATDQELVKRWSVWSADFTFPEGESVGDFIARAGGVADKLAKSEAETVLVIAHGGVLRAMLCHLLGLDPCHYLLFDAKPARLTVIDLFDQGGVLAGFNL